MDARTQTHQSMRICVVGALVGFSLSGVSAPACASWDGGIAGCFDSFQAAMETVCAINNPDSTSIPGYVYYRDKCVMTSTPNFVVYAHRVTLSTGASVSFAYTSSLTPCVFTISLSGGTAVEPSKGADIKTLPFIATIKDQNKQLVTNPITVRVSLKVDPMSGGHEHGDSTRPRGGVANVGNCESDGECWSDQTTNGSVVFNFNAPEASGTHTITATCDGCSNNPQTAKVDVKVNGLKPIPAFSYYALLEANGDVLGARPGWHTGNHNLTPSAAAVLMRISALYYFNPAFRLPDPANNGRWILPPLLHLNDASLPWGGVYDICARPGACPNDGVIAWDEPHAEHRRGTVVDVRANGGGGSIPAANKEIFKRYLKRTIKVPFLHESQGTSNEHIHIRLMGKKE